MLGHLEQKIFLVFLGNKDLRISHPIFVFHSIASSDPSTDGVVTDKGIPFSAHVLRTTTEAEQYQHFLQKQSRMQKSWSEQRRKRIATTNPAPVQPTEKLTKSYLASQVKTPVKTSTMDKEVPVTKIHASPRRENIVKRKLQEAD